MVNATSVRGNRGIEILHDPVINKATAYTEAERQALGLVGLVPDVTESEDLQIRRGRPTTRVAKVVLDSNLTRVAPPADHDAFIRSHVYKPTYRPLV
jgi:hypothetical protein